MADRTKLTLLKQDGTTIPDIDAVIKPLEILILDGELPVEEGDILMRTLPSGLADKFIIKDRGFNSFPTPHYKARYNKTTNQAPKEGITNVTYNLHGNNSRVYNDSVDLSVNISDVTISTKFTEIKDAIKTIQDRTVHPILLAKLDELQTSIFTETHRKSHQEFIALAANYTTILGPFIPFLCGLLDRLVK